MWSNYLELPNLASQRTADNQSQIIGGRGPNFYVFIFQTREHHLEHAIHVPFGPPLNISQIDPANKDQCPLSHTPRLRKLVNDG